MPRCSAARVVSQQHTVDHSSVSKLLSETMKCFPALILPSAAVCFPAPKFPTLHCHTTTLPHCHTATLNCHTTLPHYTATLHCHTASLHYHTATLHCHTATLHCHSATVNCHSPCERSGLLWPVTSEAGWDGPQTTGEYCHTLPL